MRRKAQIIGILALGLMVTGGGSPTIARFVCSAQKLHRNLFESQDSGGSLSPIERLVFKLVLGSNGGPRASNQAQGVSPERRG